jgi:tape measure domain-containing protein
MSERSIVVRLRAEVDQFRRDMAAASQALQGVGDRAQGVGDRASRSLSSMAQNARDNGEAWSSVGAGMLTVGGAITGVGLAAAKTGIQYNTLQQTSRAALTTLTGSAKDANAQMDKLDDFARTSPFAKDVFIRAQQQMLGFGIESRKVIQYLDAIQNAVAATGGSNQDIAELTRIFSQVQASAKITATDLMQFGQRGIDAATLIGSQMGKTGAQIRQDITAGTLDAQVALDALAAGMSERFEGASANVKDTFVGSMDRIKAAWRDLSSELVGGLVTPEGGGGLVDWLNSVADAMRKFQDLPGPLKVATAGMVGLAGATLTLGGGFMMLFPRLVSVWDNLARIGTESRNAQSMLVGFGKGAGLTALKAAAMAAAVVAAAKAIDQLNTALTKGDSSLANNAMARAVRQVADAGGDIEAVNEQFRNFGTILGADAVRGVNDLGSAMDAVFTKKSWTGDFHGRLQQEVERFLGAAGVMTSELELVEERFRGLDQTLSGMVQSGEIDTVRVFLDRLYTDALERGYTIDQVNGYLTDTQDALLGVEDAAPGATDTFEAVASAADVAQEALEEMAKTLQGSFVDPMGIYTDLMRTLAEATAEATEDADDSWQDYLDSVIVSIDDYAAELERQLDAQDKWRENIVRIAERGGTEVAAAVEDMGIDAAGFVDQMVNATDEDFERMAALMVRHSRAGGEGAAAEMARHMAVMESVGREGANATAYEISRELGIGLAEVSRIAREYGVELASGINPLMRGLGRPPITIQMSDGGYQTPTGARMYADGGFEDHVAQIAHPGAMRIWAEPETGGEAFMPLLAVAKATADTLAGEDIAAEDAAEVVEGVTA